MPSWIGAFDGLARLTFSRHEGVARHVTTESSFKDTLEQSAPGDVLILAPGVHSIPSLAISKRLEIIGDGATPAITTLRSALGTNADLAFFACWARVANVSFHGSSVVAAHGCLELESCRIEADVIVRDCALIYGCTLTSPTGPAAVLCDKKTRSSLVSNVITAPSGTGVRHIGLECVLVQNTIHGCMRDGIVLNGYGHLERNRVHNNGGVGLRVYTFLNREPPMEGNVISDNALGDLLVN